ncbi:MAG: hypothetical protein KGL40_07070 [Rhodocyclaceae bacterium]|nr:hypothetical protein [Rhodocyclaceae bacterium]
MLKSAINAINRHMTESLRIEHQMLQEADAFRDTRAILVRSDDARCASFWDESEAGAEQASDGPTHLVIGRLATDEQLERLSQRYSQYTLHELKAFRNAQA